MLNKVTFLLFVIFLYSYTTYSQNTNEKPSLVPDSSKSNNLSIPASGGGSASPSPALAPENELKGGNANPLEIEIQSAPTGNMKMEETPAVMEEAPTKSEPVPGAEILIEQEQNDIRSQSPAVQPTKENKEKKKKEKKPNK